MGFLGVYRAIYDYAPQAEGELGISDGDLLYVLDKNGDEGWWKAKKKAGADDEDEPVGLVPNNYVEKADPVAQARALFEYTRQTDEELSFPEDAQLEVLDTTDPDWILVGLDGDYGFVPSNYIEIEAVDKTPSPPAAPAPPALPTRPQPETTQPESPAETASPPSNPAAALASVMQRRSASQAAASPPPQPTRASVSFQDAPEPDDEPVRSPALPARPRQSMPPVSPSYADPISPVEASTPVESFRTPGGFHMYNINEMVSVMGKRKKMPTTLGINLGTGTILIAPERASDGPSQEWTADRMTHYSREEKHIFLELVRPSKSVDFHAGAKDTAMEIVNALGELAGAVKAEGLREVIMAGSGRSKKKGEVLYDFMAQGEDEVTVAVGDEVLILDDSKSQEWWEVRRLKNGKEGVVPSSYVEITGTMTPPPVVSGVNSGKSTIEQNRLEEIRLTKEAIRASKEPQQVGPGMPLPERGSSLMARENGSNSGQQRNRRENGRSDGGHPKSKSRPDPAKVRTWTDRSRSFSVEAQFLGLKDGKIHLHKMNGVKIAVPITKMSREDLEYVENLTGISLDDDRPLADVKRARSSDKRERAPEAGATIEKPKKPEYDWFQFFLSCEVAVGLCERYAQAFVKDSMDESVLPDVDASTLRTLGLREGDIIKVMRTLDAKFGRNRGGKRNVSFASDSGADGESGGGLFSGPGGTLRNNTRKGRPAPAVQTSDVVDVNAFSKPDSSTAADGQSRSPTATSPAKTATPEPQAKTSSGFDDDAWDVKPSKQAPAPEPQPISAPDTSAATAKPAAVAAPPAPQALTGSMKELSLLSDPLQPTRAEPAPVAVKVEPQVEPAVVPAAPQSQLSGATPAFFSSVAQAQPPAQIASLGGHTSPQSLLRQRPAPPQISPSQGLVPPPPQRPLSAPQSAQASAFSPPPMMPQMTGALQGQVAPPGQSLNDITQARLQQQYTAQLQQQQQQQPVQLQPAMTGFGPQAPVMMPFSTGNPNQFMQPMMTGAPVPNQFQQIQAQPTGFQSPFPGMQPPFNQMPQGSINNYLPPALEPQRTGVPAFQPQVTGISGMNGSMQPLQPLQPQQTGPPPAVRFGVTGEAKKLAPQPTGRRANLAQATPQNPFGF